MKTIGLIGGSSWISSMDYYRLLNESVHRKLGGHNYARCIMYSFNFADIKKLNDAKDWSTTLTLVTGVSKKLASAGAECIVLCANTMHVIAEDLSRAIELPIIHIADATADAIVGKGLQRVGLLGTKFTMEMDFFTRKLEARQIETIIPPEEDREFIHTTIFDELAKGIVREATKREYLDIIRGLTKQGVQGVILGCSEIPLLIEQRDCTIPLFDTVAIHVEEAVRFALRDGPSLPDAGATGGGAGGAASTVPNPPAAR